MTDTWQQQHVWWRQRVISYCISVTFMRGDTCSESVVEDALDCRLYAKRSSYSVTLKRHRAAASF